MFCCTGYFNNYLCRNEENYLIESVMLEVVEFTLYTALLFFLETSYFRIAQKFNILDRPNIRSSHSVETLRGGGIVFPLGFFAYVLVDGFPYPYLCAGLLIISIVSFYDDIKPVVNRVRVLCQLAAVSLMFLEAQFLNHPIWLILIVYVIVIGTINAYNFMDGVNGITAAYSLVTCLTLLYINENVIEFASSKWLLATVLTIFVFGFFNFRAVAKCFAGDVGSISIAFILIFFILVLILTANDLKYVGLFLIYGLDSVTTILFRLIRRENIFEAHRSHFYQFLANTKKWPHLSVSMFYALLQILTNVLIIQDFVNNALFVALLLISGILVITVRLFVEGKNQLLKSSLIVK